MVITVDPELEAALAASARAGGTTPEVMVLTALRERFLNRPAVTPRDEWERRLFAAASDCGVSLSDAALSREALYD